MEILSNTISPLCTACRNQANVKFACWDLHTHSKCTTPATLNDKPYQIQFLSDEGFMVPKCFHKLTSVHCEGQFTQENSKLLKEEPDKKLHMLCWAESGTINIFKNRQIRESKLYTIHHH